MSGLPSLAAPEGKKTPLLAFTDGETTQDKGEGHAWCKHHYFTEVTLLLLAFILKI